MPKLLLNLIGPKKLRYFLSIFFRPNSLATLLCLAMLPGLCHAQSKDMRFPTTVLRQSSKSFPEYDGRSLNEWGKITTYFEDTATIDIRSFLKPIVENEVLYFIHRSSQKVVAEGVVESVFEDRNFAKVRLLKVKRKTRPTTFKKSVAVRLIQIIQVYRGKSSLGNKPLQITIGGSSNKYQSLDFLLKSNLDKRVLKFQGSVSLFPPYGVTPKALNRLGLRLTYARALEGKINLKTGNSLTNKASLSQVKADVDLIYSYTQLRLFPQLMFFIRAYSDTKDKVTLFDEGDNTLEEIELKRQGYTAGALASYALGRAIQLGFSTLFPISQKLSILDLSNERESSGQHSTFDKTLFLRAQVSHYFEFSTGLTHRSEEFVDTENDTKRSFEDTIAWANVGLLL